MPAATECLATPAETLVGRLRRRAAKQPGRNAYTWLADGEEPAGSLTWGELDVRARAVAARLAAAGAGGERALLLYPPGLDFIAAFFGCLYAGAVAVPAYPPRLTSRSALRRDDPRLAAVAGDAQPQVVLATAAIAEAGPALAARIPGLAAAEWIATDGLSDAGIDAFDLEEPAAADLAFLQYTSGSTASPKGVMVRHGNLAANERMIAAAFRQDEESVVVGWLPLYHDMGLIGNVLQPLWSGGRCVLMSPVAFLQRPLRWLAAIDRYRATTSGGPNFAYDLCARKIGAEERARLDLASWRVAYNGAEPVRAATLERFAAAFATAGFRREAFYPCYGLAEATLFAAGGDPGRPPRIAGFDAGALARGQAAEAEGEERLLVSCGGPAGGGRIAVVDPETGAPAGPGEVGEVWIAGPHVAAGYWGRPEESERAFQARTAAGDGPFLRTGDLGFLDRGELFVTGRIKELIILRGRNLYPQDLEATAEAAHPALRPGCGAAFAVEAESEERLVLVQEVERHAGAPTEEIAGAVRRAVAAEHEAVVWELVLVRTGTVPKTSSGKVQRLACRAAYLADGLDVVARSVLGPGGAEGPDEAGQADLATLIALPVEERSRALLDLVREEAGRVLGVEGTHVEPERPLTALGLDSLAGIELQHRLEKRLGRGPAIAALLDGASVIAIAAELAPRLGEEAEAPLPEPAAPAGDFPLSHGQEGLWFLERLAPGTYNLAVAARAEDLGMTALRAALAGLIERHPALRVSFHAAPGEASVQRIAESVEPDFAEEDVAGWSDERLARRLAEEAWRPFDLGRAPLLRTRVFHGGPAGDVVLFAIHHLIADFASVAILARDLATLYARTAPPASLPRLFFSEPAARYAAAIHRQRQHLAGPEGERLWAFWQQRLAGLEDLHLPADRPRPAMRSWRGGARSLSLPEAHTAALRALARERSATLHAVLLAAFLVQLHRSTGREDLAAGTPTAGRECAETAELAGYFVNPVVVRADLGGDPPFAEALERVRRAALDALAHAELPFPLLAERLRPARDPARPPLVSTMLSFQRDPAGVPGLAAFALGAAGARLNLGGLTLSALALPERRAPFDLALRIAETGTGLALELEHDADRFDGATAARMLGHFRNLLLGIAAGPEARLSDLPLLSARERAQVLAEWSGATASPGAPGRPVHEEVAGWAARTTEAEAVVSDAERLTYDDLVACAARLARHLRRRGVGPEVRVAVCLARSPSRVVAQLAVLQAGGAYLPLDPSRPPERLARLLEDALAGGGPAIVLSEEALAEKLPRQVAVLRLDADSASWAGEEPAPPAVEVRPENAAYAIYTSGSTGEPKGVVVSHGALANLVGWHREAFGVGPGDRSTLLAGAGFDASVWETWACLAAGASLHLPSEETRSSSARLVPWLAEKGITVAFLPTPLAEAVLAEEWPAGSRLRALLTGGDRLHRGPRPGLPFALHNQYGPTEAAVVATWGRVEAGEGAPPIGRPIAGAEVYLLDGRLRPVPAGVPGELCVGGAGLARGYLGRPDATAERFRPHPFAARPGERLYLTGDLARWRPDGEIDFLGRADRQVKVWGVRVEPGEVEATLAAHPAVREAAVVARDAGPGGGARLAAYVVFGKDSGKEDVTGLAAWLRERLPEAMVPASFVALEALPVTPNGKVDRAALAAREDAAAGAGPVAPRTPVEEVLAGMLAEALGVERVGVEDDFFALGGHSLLAARLASRAGAAFGVELPVGELFRAPTVAALAVRVEAARRSGADPEAWPFERVPAGVDPPLSFAQQRLWFLDQVEPGSAAYNLAGALDLAGPLDPGRLAAALAAAVERHEALRTVYLLGPDGPVQRVVSKVEVPLPRIDLLALPGAIRVGEAARLSSVEARQPFDLVRGPLLRTLLLRLSGGEHRLLFTLHHIAADGASIVLLMREIAELYGTGAVASPAPVRYADFAWSQRRWMEDGRLERQMEVWARRLGGELPVLELPADRPRPEVASSAGGRRAIVLPPELAMALERTGRAGGATLFMTLFAGFAALLARWTDREDLVIGTPVANRGRVETEGLIGCLVNAVALRADLSGRPSFAALLGRAREACLEAYENQDLPFERLVVRLRPERRLSQTPLFQVMLTLEEPLAPRFAGLGAALSALETGTAKFDLTLAFERGADRPLRAALEYRADLFDPATAERMLGHLGTLLAAAAADPSRPVAELPLLTSAERAEVEARRPAAGTRELRPIHRRFAEWAERTPEAVAVVCGEARLTYGGLALRAGRLARRLRELGVGPEERVAVQAGRSVDLVIALLAVLEAGGAYLPLDPDYPAERLAFMLEDAGARVLLAGGPAPAPPVGGVRVLPIAAEAPDGTEETVPSAPAVEPENAAYVIYTSGSTGRPKGVVVTHGNVDRLFAATAGWFGFGPGDVWTMFHSYAFDFSVWEMWGALAHGGRLVVVPREVARAPEALLGLLRRERVTVLSQTPSAFLQLAEADAEAPAVGDLALEEVVFGGEALDPVALRSWADRRGLAAPRLVNMYGITETTVHVTFRPLAAVDLAPGRGSRIGVPIPDLEVVLADRHLQPVPVGVPGEMLVGGAGLARGYLGRPGLTAERFVPHPFPGRPGERLYRSGDLARRRPDGDLEYLGRSDHQVKVRGFRVELGEIESALLAHPAVRRAVVAARAPSGSSGAGRKRLVAWVVARGGDGEALVPELRAHLRSRLPEHMVPAAFVLLDELPATASGKVDRRALPEPDGAGGERAYEAPRDEVERLISDLWRELLGLERVGVHDNFFDLGGHSLLVTQVHRRLREALGRELPVVALFRYPTVAALAGHLTETGPVLALAAQRDRAEARLERMGRQRRFRERAARR